MKNLRQFSQAFPTSRLWSWMMFILFAFMANPVLADELDDDKNFTVIQYKDHVHFKIMIMDGKNKDTWCRVGSIHAYSQDDRKGTHMQLMDVECDQGEDNSTNKEIFSRNVLEGTKAFLTNPAVGDNPVIQFASWDEWGDGNNDDVRSARPNKVRYTIKKESSNLRPCVEIDYYWNADMAGKTWYFTYEFIHNAGSFKARKMGSAFCSSDLGLGTIDYHDISYSRENSDKILFTVPALPNDVPAKLQDYIKHYCEYELHFTYTLYDGSEKKQSEVITCETGHKKTYELTIPKEVGNFKNAELYMYVSSGLQWSNKKKERAKQIVYRNNIFTSVPVPFGLAAEYNQFEDKALLSWNAFPTGDNNYIKESIPYVYRVETDDNGNPVSGASWAQRGKLAAVGNEQSEGYTDNMLSPNTHYKYMVLNVPKAWLENNSITASDLTDPKESTIHLLGSCVSDPMPTTPKLTIFNLAQDTTVLDKVRLTWEYSRVPIKSNNVKFQIWKRQKGTSDWNDYGNVTVPSNPSAGYIASFIDDKLPSVRETFEYKVVLAINDGENTFESDVITAGLLTGSAVLSVDATKGTHENVVRVSWQVKQIGTENSNFEVYRRYAGTNDEYLKVHSVSGTSDSYTYEDNTVQPGYFYEYRVDVYSGGKETYTDNNFQNFLSDVGFCQARGVISGRVTFGTGSAVEDVRLSLRSNSDNDGNVIRGFSQRFDGLSTGVKWDADSVSLAKLFGSGKEYTLQLFVRPDDNLSEGAIIAEIPFYGRIRLGAKNGENYPLLVEKYGQRTTERTSFNNVWDVKCITINYANDRDTSVPYYFNEEIGGNVYNDHDLFNQLFDQLEEQGYKRIPQVFWYEDTDLAVYVFGKQIPLDIKTNKDDISWEGAKYDTGVSLPADTYSLITLKNDGTSETVSVNESVSSGLTQTGTKQYHIEGGDIKYLYPDYDVWNGNCLFHYEGGVKRELFDTYYGMTSNQFAWYPANASGYSSTVGTLVAPFAVGGSEIELTEEEAFMGNMTEVRVWNHVLTDKEKENTADRILTGTEKGLSLYWPMDEGISRFVFDASFANDVPNGRHAKVGNNISSSTIVPTETQLSRYGLTNENGEYTVRGLPFIGSGTTYSVTPTKGIHVFSPLSRNGFIGSGNLALNNYDFTDTSSFPVRGRITYLDTNIPADSIQFKIDGQLVQGASNKTVMTDSNGDYEISVPIGKHLIEAYKDGHRLTSFPLDGTTYDFKQEMTVNFIDSTLVNVTGRINGGFSDQDEPLGFARSKNRLGKATIKLSLGQESRCSFNYITDEHGSGEFGKTPIPILSATDMIQSTGYRAAATEHDDDTHFVYITTDPNTGEFSALLPPLKYKVESITFDGGNEYDNKDVFVQNLPFIDATNTVEKTWRSDSLTTDGVVSKYTYVAKFKRQYRAEPSITFEQVGMKNGAFGEVKVPVVSFTESVDSVTVLTYNGDSFKYEYDYPVFCQEQAYVYDIAVAETYKNLDTGEEFEEVPSDAIISIDNNACASISFFCEEGYVNGEKVTPGMAYEVPRVRIKPKKDGHATYQFLGGIPNLGGNHLRTMSLDVTIDGRTTMWTDPKTSKPELNLILLGSLSSGNQNFVTNGPQHVDMILRRPPGSTSEAVLKTDTLTTDMKLEAHVRNGGTSGGGFYVSVVPEITQSIDVAAGRVYVEHKFQPQANTQEQWDSGSSTIDETDSGSKYSVSTEIHGTTEGIQYHGDTYIGRSTNMLFGKGNTLGFFKQDNGSYKIDIHESIVVSESFGTYFAFPQEYIEETLIPNWKAIIKARLSEGYINANHWEKGNAPIIPGKVMYYTSYKEGDPEFGRSNGDSRWGDLISARGGHPSYYMRAEEGMVVDDEVDNAIRQIKAWEQAIAMNEKDKLEAIKGSGYFIQNYSIAGGTSINQTTTNEKVYVKRDGTEHEWNFDSETHAGFMYSGAGAYAIIHVTKHTNDSDVKEKENTTSTSVEWTMSDGDPRTALSVDVYKSPMGYGPIFRTRGGQSVNPWEGATYTQYYQKGTKLDEATMRVEWPQLRVEGATTLTDVPTGGQGAFDLEMTNLSETNSDCTYILEAIEASNAQGAILMIDGMPLSLGKNGRAINLKGDKEPVHKMLYVSQSDRSVNKFEDLQLVLRSQNDDNMTSDTLHLKVEFVPASALIDMAVAHTVLNYDDLKKYGGFQVRFTNLDRQDQGLAGVRIQSRRKGTDSWNEMHKWVVDPAKLEQGDDLLPPTDETFEYAVSFPSDGIYELRGQTYGLFGKQEVTYETPIIEVIQDTRGPKILGMASHDGNTLTYADRNDMHVRFNEVLNANAISESDNFRIEGGLNNVAAKSQYHDVALQLDNQELQTEASFNLENTDLALDFWVYPQSNGSMLSLGIGKNRLEIFTNEEGKLGTIIGSDVVMSNTVLPLNRWNYVAASYMTPKEGDPENRFTMLYVGPDDKSYNIVIDNVAVDSLFGESRLYIGNENFKGRMYDLSLWNAEKSVLELYETRLEQKAAYTPGLVGYWRMDEGHGTLVSDDVLSRHITMPAESWYINNRNLAAHLDGTDALKVDISTANTRTTDNFAVEMWFRGDKDTVNDNAQLLSVLNGMSIGFKEGKLVLEMSERTVANDNTETKTVNESISLSNVNYCDNNWHHLALNVRRGTSAVVYVDGEAVKTLSESSIPAITGHYMYVGGEQTLVAPDGTNAGGCENLFHGDVDEIRIWNAAIGSDILADRRFERLDNTYAGLMGYFPMEEINREQTGNIESHPSTDNFGVKDSQMKLEGTLVQSVNAPALLPGSSRIRLADTDFNFTVSNDEIYFSFQESMYPLMDGNEFDVTVKNIKDEHGNYSEPVMWKFRCDFAAIDWTEDVINIEKKWDETKEFEVSLRNQAGSSIQSYEISGLPSWLTVNQPIGTLNGATAKKTFTILPSVPVGKYTVNVYVTDRLGIKRMLEVNITVKGDEPNWAVNPDLYESNMMVIGQIYIGDKICEYTDSKIAAFNEDGNCIGVASPHYVETRDAYFVDMVIYGGSSTELSTNERKISFEIYDASTGQTCPLVMVVLPGVEMQLLDIDYAPDAVYGSYDDPVVFKFTQLIQQNTDLVKGWSWKSIYIEPLARDIDYILPTKPNDLNKFLNIKGHKAFATVNKSTSEIVGELNEMVPGNMYKIQVSAPVKLNIYGTLIDLEETTQTIYPGFNWIGTLSSSIMSPADAFADLKPLNGDMVKNRTSLSTYRDGVWEGTLKNIVPGEGYIYMSKATEARSFHYPNLSGTNRAAALDTDDEFNALFTSYYIPVDEHLFPDNMNFIAVVEKNGIRMENAEVGAFVNGECRGAVRYNNGYYFLSVLGSSSDDLSSEVELRVYTDGEEFVFEKKLPFISDAILGTLDEPYVLDVAATAIRTVTFDDIDDDNDWFTLQGVKLNHRPSQQGVYLHRGEKVVIKRR
ncbi:MAG: hypothetical protein IKX36_11360 [Prevotella sp.]|nr:hypothetical protein [Prevotella sp.]